MADASDANGTKPGSLQEAQYGFRPTYKESLTAPAENLHGLHEAAAAIQAQAAAEAAAAAAAAGIDQAEQQGQAVYRAPHEGQPGDHQEPALQAEESLLPELPEGSDTKRCAACRIVKPTSEYYKDRTHSRGIKTRCKQCLRACKEAFKNQQRAKSASEQVTVTSKKCSHCNQEKPASEFSRSSYQRTGLRSWCKDCSSKSKKQAKAEGRWKSYDSKTKPRKCRKCDEVRQPEEFPMDPRNPQKRLRDCTYCMQQDMAGGAVPAGGPPGMSPTAGADPSANAMAVAAAQGGGWGGHVGEGFWHVDPARAQQMQAEAYQPPASESLMRILRAAMAGDGEGPRRFTPEMLSQLGVYPDPNDPFSELPPETQTAIIQQFVDQQQQQAAQQQRHTNALLQGNSAGFAPEMLYQQREMAMQGLAFSQGQRPPTGEALSHWGQPPPEQQHEQAAAAQQHPEGPGEPDKHQGPPLGVSHFEQLRNVPYASEGWQPPQHLLQQQQLIPGHDWPSAFAPAPRMAADAGQGSPKRQRTEHE